MSTPYDRPNESAPLTWPFLVSQGVPFVVSLSNHAFRVELSFDRLRTNVALIE